MTSLRARLYAALAALAVAGGLLSGVVVYRWAFDEAIELQDGLLAQIGAFLAHGRPGLDAFPTRGVDPDARVSFIELDGAPADARRPLTGVPASAADGLHTLTLGGQSWRVLVETRADGGRFAVGQPAEARDEIARGSAFGAAAPFAALLPCQLILIALVIHYSFRPVSQLTDALERDEGSGAAPLAVAGIPDELRPFISAIDRLVGRLKDRLDRERRFIADAAHELRTPLAALTVQAQNLENAPTDDERKRRAGELNAGLRRTAHLLDQLLDHARYDSGGPHVGAPVDICAVARETVADLLPLAQEKAIDLGFTRTEEALARIAPAAFAAVARNLVGNALRHAPDGGRIDVAVYAAGDRAILCVTDDGPGVPADELELILDPFKRGRAAAGEGAGLGLAIVRRIAERAGGELILQNVGAGEGGGFRASLALPLASPSRPST